MAYTVGLGPIGRKILGVQISPLLPFNYKNDCGRVVERSRQET